MGKKYGQNRGNNPPQALPKGRDIHVKEQTTLLAFLLETLKEQSRTAVKSLLSHGQIMINGQSIRQFDAPLEPGGPDLLRAPESGIQQPASQHYLGRR